MTREELKELLRNPALADAGRLPDLTALSEQYPYCGALHRLILIALHRNGDLRYSSELGRRILSVPDPRELFLTLKGTPAGASRESATASPGDCPEGGSSAAAPFDVIADFLEEHPEDVSEIESLLDSGEPETASLEEAPQKEETAGEIVEAFLSRGPEAEIIRPQEPDPDESRPKEAAPTDDPSEGEYLTETLARIYIRQGKWRGALRIFRSINLKYPKKSGYFAEQIAYLENILKFTEAMQPPKTTEQ